MINLIIWSVVIGVVIGLLFSVSYISAVIAHGIGMSRLEKLKEKHHAERLEAYRNKRAKYRNEKNRSKERLGSAKVENAINAKLALAKLEEADEIRSQKEKKLYLTHHRGQNRLRTRK